MPNYANTLYMQRLALQQKMAERYTQRADQAQQLQTSANDKMYEQTARMLQMTIAAQQQELERLRGSTKEQAMVKGFKGEELKKEQFDPRAQLEAEGGYALGKMQSAKTLTAAEIKQQAAIDLWTHLKPAFEEAKEETTRSGKNETAEIMAPIRQQATDQQGAYQQGTLDIKQQEVNLRKRELALKAKEINAKLSEKNVNLSPELQQAFTSFYAQANTLINAKKGMFDKTNDAALKFASENETFLTFPNEDLTTSKGFKAKQYYLQLAEEIANAKDLYADNPSKENERTLIKLLNKKKQQLGNIPK